MTAACIARTHSFYCWALYISFCCLVDMSCLTLWGPWGLPGSSVHGISQARTLAWVAIALSRDSSPPRDQTCIPSVGTGIFTTEPTGNMQERPSWAWLLQLVLVAPLHCCTFSLLCGMTRVDRPWFTYPFYYGCTLEWFSVLGIILLGTIPEHVSGEHIIATFCCTAFKFGQHLSRNFLWDPCTKPKISH